MAVVFTAYADSEPVTVSVVDANGAFLVASGNAVKDPNTVRLYTSPPRRSPS
jgi:hypothetical protein